MSEVTDACQRLRTVALEQSLSGEFPVWLLADILALAEAPERLVGKADLIRRLTEMVLAYDPYAGTGCFDTGASIGMIQMALRRITGDPGSAAGSPGE